MNVGRQIRILQFYVGFLSVLVIVLAISVLRSQPRNGRFATVQAERVEIREHDGTIKAVLSSADGFGERAQQTGSPHISGLMFYNEEGQETGGLTYRGKTIPGGQNSDVSLTMDQYRQDQNVVLNHSERADKDGLNISDGLAIVSRPDWHKAKEEYAFYKEINALPESEQPPRRLELLEQGRISTRRLFYGVRRGTKDGAPYDEAGIFIRNRFGRDAIKLYVDYDNKPHLQVFDTLGIKVVYDLDFKRVTH
ncbi:MAG: hypothetical protein WA324_00210 [Bryobacteraceae bacterium]